jgi:ribosomal-protein-alanine N-acetyltransferase
MVGWNVRRADGRDLAKIRAVERSSVGSPHWSEAVWSEVLSADTTVRAVFVAELEDEVVGFLAAAARVAAVVEVESVAVVEKTRRRGVAKALAAQCIAWAREAGAEQIELEVRASNVGARELYRSLGFVEQGKRRGYYQGPLEDAVLMGLALGDGGYRGIGRPLADEA